LETTFRENTNIWRNPVTKSKRLVQAYRQAPWRTTTQRGVLILIVAILGASVLWVMVSVTIQAASAGLEIQRMESEREDLSREIAGLRTGIANQTSAVVMEQRAADLGFAPVDPANITYLVLPGYKGREPVIHAPPPGSMDRQTLIKPSYTQSLWEWMLQGILEVGGPAGTGQPPGGVIP
jgi:hypothetical protein